MRLGRLPCSWLQGLFPDICRHLMQFGVHLPHMSQASLSRNWRGGLAREHFEPPRLHLHLDAGRRPRVCNRTRDYLTGPTHRTVAWVLVVHSICMDSLGIQVPTENENSWSPPNFLRASSLNLPTSRILELGLKPKFFPNFKAKSIINFHGFSLILMDFHWFS